MSDRRRRRWKGRRGRTARGTQGMTIGQMIDYLEAQTVELEDFLWDLPSDWDDVDDSQERSEYQPGAATLNVGRSLKKKTSKLLNQIYKDLDYLRDVKRGGRL